MKIEIFTCVSVPVTMLPTLLNAGTTTIFSECPSKRTKFGTQPALITA